VGDYGSMSRAAKGGDCKFPGGSLRRFESCSAHSRSNSSAVEHSLGKGEAMGSIPIWSLLIEQVRENNGEKRQSVDGEAPQQREWSHVLHAEEQAQRHRAARTDEVRPAGAEACSLQRDEVGTTCKSFASRHSLLAVGYWLLVVSL
jgi:hypothetical protein